MRAHCRVHGWQHGQMGLRFMRVMRSVIIVAVLATSAQADVDWATGMVEGRGVGVANRAAPNPATARGPARRAAEDAARVRLREQVSALPVAGGGTVGTQAKDKAVMARVEQAIADAIEVSAEPETDGSWIVKLAVPTEAIRQALAGPRGFDIATDDDGPAVVIVEGATATPAVGWKVGALDAAVIFVKDVPAWAKGAPKVKATGTGKGVIELAATGSASTLFVVVTP